MFSFINKSYCPYCIHKFKNNYIYRKHLNTLKHREKYLKKIHLFKIIINDTREENKV